MKYKIKLSFIIILSTILLPLLSPINSVEGIQSNNIFEIEGNEEIVLTEWTGSYIIHANVQVDSCYLYCHIPVIHDGQSPIVINNIWSEPPNKIKDYCITQNYTGSNKLLNISFNSLDANESVTIFYSVSTIIKSKDYDDLPNELPLPTENSLPNNTRRWIESTDFIQSNHWRIRLVAHLLKVSNDNLITIANRLTTYTGKIIRYKGFFSQDALSTLRRHYAVCTGKANLGAALFRALGIPARVLMVYPTHFIIEYYAYPYGWVHAETTIGEMPFPNQRYTIAYCAYPEDESSTNSINGQSPYLGVIAYWGVSNPNAYFIINYEKWELTYNQGFEISEEKLNETLSLTSGVWYQYSKYSRQLLNEPQNYLYNEAIGKQLIAISFLKENKVDDYIKNMHLANDIYKLIEF